MAHVYEVICPNCGNTFQITKGVTVSELKSGEQLPKSRDAGEPDCCPNCHYRLSVNDAEFNSHVTMTMLVD